MPFYFNAVPFCLILLFPQRSEPVCLYHSSFVVIAAMMLIIPRVHHTRRHPHCHRCPRPHDSKVTSEHSLSTLWMIAWLHLKCQRQGKIPPASRPALFKLVSSNKGLYWGHRFKCCYAENSSQCQPEATQLGKSPLKGLTVASNWSGGAVQWCIAAKKREFISRDTSQSSKLQKCCWIFDPRISFDTFSPSISISAQPVNVEHRPSFSSFGLLLF